MAAAANKCLALNSIQANNHVRRMLNLEDGSQKRAFEQAFAETFAGDGKSSLKEYSKKWQALQTSKTMIKSPLHKYKAEELLCQFYIRIDDISADAPFIEVKFGDIARSWRQGCIRRLKSKQFWGIGRHHDSAGCVRNDEGENVYNDDFWDFLVAYDEWLTELYEMGKEIPKAIAAGKEAHKDFWNKRNAEKELYDKFSAGPASRGKPKKLSAEAGVYVPPSAKKASMDAAPVKVSNNFSVLAPDEPVEEPVEEPVAEQVEVPVAEPVEEPAASSVEIESADDSD